MGLRILRTATEDPEGIIRQLSSLIVLADGLLLLLLGHEFELIITLAWGRVSLAWFASAWTSPIRIAEGLQSLAELAERSLHHLADRGANR